MHTEETVIVDASTLPLHDCLHLVRGIARRVHAVAISPDFTFLHPGITHSLRGFGVSRIFVDANLYAEPAVAAARGERLRRLGVTVVSVHAFGGGQMIEAMVGSGVGEIWTSCIPASVNTIEVWGEGREDLAVQAFDIACRGGASGIIGTPREIAAAVAAQSVRARTEPFSSQNMKFIVRGGVFADEPDGISRTFADALGLGATQMIVDASFFVRDPIGSLERIEAEIALERQTRR